MENRCRADRKRMLKKGRRKGLGNKEGISHLPWVWDRPKKISSCLPQQKKKQTQKHIHTYTLNTNNNKLLEAQADQTRIDLSHKERVARGEREERKRDRGRSRGIVFTHVWLSGLQAPHPSHSHSLLCHSQRHVSLYLPISLSINLHLPSSSLQDQPLPLLYCLPPSLPAPSPLSQVCHIRTDSRRAGSDQKSDVRLKKSSSHKRREDLESSWLNFRAVKGRQRLESFYEQIFGVNAALIKYSPSLDIPYIVIFKVM